MHLGRKTILTCGLMLAAVVVWVLFSGPMLINVRTGPLSGDRSLTAFNPIRNRAPEQYAVSLLTQIQSETCQQVMSGLAIADQQKSEACRKQVQDPINANCRLVERMDKGNSIWLLYQCPYRRPTEAFAEVGMTVEKKGSQCLLRSYERIY